MKKTIAIIIFLLTNLGAFAAADNNMLWQKANNLYQQKQFDSAAQYYEQIAAQHPQEAKVYYNLGSAYYRANKIGLAVLNFERALRIDPNYKDAADNLLLTQNRIPGRIRGGQDIFFVRWWQHTTNPSNANAWAIVSVLIFLLLIGALLLRRFRKPGWLMPQVLIATGAIWALILIIAIQSATNAVTHDSAVVMQNDTPLMNAYGQTKVQSLIPEGTTVKITATKAGWAEVQLPDSRTGWIQEAQLTKI
ncbi:tetratricopeptide repeat protein [Chitinophagaceae bacterium MMS25-I14]